MCGCVGCHLLTTDIERETSRDGSREMEVENRRTKEEMDMKSERRERQREQNMMLFGGGGVCVHGGGLVAAGI